MPDFGPGWEQPGLTAWIALAAAGAVLLAAGVLLYARATRAGLWRAGLAVFAVAVAWSVAAAFTAADRAALRRALDARTAELTARALAPGSPLACLDALAHEGVEAACRKALFAHPETVAAAIAYVDARLALLSDALALAAQDRGYAGTLERSRRALEEDRFGIVAQALAARGCTASECAAFKLLRDPSRVVANLNERAFDAEVALHGAAWTQNAAAPAVSAPAPASPPVAALAAPAIPSAIPSPQPAPPGVPVSPQYDFPSADSIPAVSIMDPEPARAAAQPPASAPRPAARRAPAQPPPGPPTAIVPQPPATTGGR